MAVVVSRLFAPVQLGTSLTTLYTSTGAKTILDKLTLVNTSGGSISGIDVHIIPNGGSASNTTKVIAAKSLAANETYVCPEVVGHVLETGEFLQALAGTTASISARGSGRVVT